MEGNLDEFEYEETFYLHNVPHYLRESLYYLSCLENIDQNESDSTLSNIPLQCRKADTSVQTHSDLLNLLHTIRFWCLPDLPIEVINYCLKTKFELPDIIALHTILTEFKVNFVEVNQLKSILFDRENNWMDTISRCNSAIERDCKNMLEIILASGAVVTEDHWSGMVSTAAQYDRLHCLVYLHSIAGIYTFTEYHAGAAAEAGAISCLQYLLEHSVEGVSKHWMIPTSAARAGQLRCLQYAHQHGCQMGSIVVSFAISSHQIECLNYPLSVNCPYDASVTATAATLGHLDCLQVLHEHGCGFDPLTCENAAGNNHLSCLVYAHAHGSELNEESHFRALKHGYLDIIKYVYEAGVPFNRRLCHTAIYHGQLECLKFMIEHGCPWVEDPLKLALQFKQQHIFEYTLQCGFV